MSIAHKQDCKTHLSVLKFPRVTSAHAELPKAEDRGRGRKVLPRSESPALGGEIETARCREKRFALAKRVANQTTAHSSVGRAAPF